MSIKFLERNQIDDSQWNKCVSEASNGIIYAYTWYLDIAAPGWCALVAGSYEYIFPLPYRRILGYRIGYHPIFAQQLGLLSRNVVDDETLLQFLNKIPFKKFYLQLNMGNRTSTEKFKITTRTNYHLDLNHTYEELLKNYNRSNRKSCIKSYNRGIKVVRNIPFDEYWDFYFTHTKLVARKQTYCQQKNLIAECLNRNAGFLLGAYTADDVLCSVLFVGNSNGYVMALFGNSSELGLKLRAAFAIYDQLIKEYANSKTILDFEGSDIPSIANVFEGFGAIRLSYQAVETNRLPAHINLLLNAEKALKGSVKKIIKRHE